MNLLKVIQSSDKETFTPAKKMSQREISRLEQEAKWERYWLTYDINKRKSARALSEKERVLTCLSQFQGHAVVLGSGDATLVNYLADLGLKVDALDISRNALKKISRPDVKTYHDFFPYTKLEDDAYDLVVCHHILAELPQNDLRMALSEIYRLLKKSGHAVISTPIDIYSEDALLNFILLLETELEIEELILSYQALSIRLPIFKYNGTILKALEAIGQFIWHDQAISHIVAITKKRPFTPF